MATVKAVPMPEKLVERFPHDAMVTSCNARKQTLLRRVGYACLALAAILFAGLLLVGVGAVFDSIKWATVHGIQPEFWAVTAGIFTSIVVFFNRFSIRILLYIADTLAEMKFPQLPFFGVKVPIVVLAAELFAGMCTIVYVMKPTTYHLDERATGGVLVGLSLQVLIVSAAVIVISLWTVRTVYKLTIGRPTTVEYVRPDGEVNQITVTLLEAAAIYLKRCQIYVKA